MRRLCWPLALLFALATLVLAYTFLIQGSSLPARDGRQAILLSPGERDLVLAEMRGFLVAVQQITAALARDDLAAAAVAARKVGAGHQPPPASLIGKLPLAFKRLGFDTHDRFDRLALDTEALADPQHSLAALAELMQNCVGCHAAWRFGVEGP